MRIRRTAAVAWFAVLLLAGTRAPALPQGAGPAGQGKDQGDAGQRPVTGREREALFAKIAAAMSGVKAIVATFDQEKHYALFDDVVRHEGFILYRRSDKLRWEIRKPFRSILIVAGARVAKFEFRKGERRKLELGRASDVLLVVMDQIRGWFAGDFAKSEKDYAVDVFATTPVRIVMKPRSKALGKQIESFELVLAADLVSVTTVTIREKGGDRTVMRFHRQAGAAAPADACFDTEAPRDFDPDKAKPAPAREKNAPDEAKPAPASQKNAPAREKNAPDEAKPAPGSRDER